MSEGNMMARSKIGMHMDDATSDIDFEAISEGEETKCSDDIWNITRLIKMRLWIWKSMPEREASKSDSKPQLALLS
jgi:hypothetical protein